MSPKWLGLDQIYARRPELLERGELPHSPLGVTRVADTHSHDRLPTDRFGHVRCGGSVSQCHDERHFLWCFCSEVPNEGQYLGGLLGGIKGEAGSHRRPYGIHVELE